MPSKPKTANVLRREAQAYLKNPKDVSKLDEIVSLFLAGESTYPCLLALELIFTRLLKDSKMTIAVDPFQKDGKKVNTDLATYYKTVFEHLGKCLESNNPKVKVQALAVCMKFIEYEGVYPIIKTQGASSTLPQGKLKKVLSVLLSKDVEQSGLIEKFTEYLEYDDIVYYTWISLSSLIIKFATTPIYIANFLDLIEKLPLKKREEPVLLCEGENFNFDVAIIKKHINSFWPFIMNWVHVRKSQHKLLLLLLEKILNCLDSPLLLTDFFIDALDIGGTTSILALEGIYKLMQLEHINYPRIFTSLYSLLEPPVFHTKYKARLFNLTDLFLRSTHISEQLVAGFVKRLARLTLVVPSEDTIVICKLIHNLILRHPGLTCLLNKTYEKTSEDCYIMEETDPCKSKAMGSFLWEIDTLKMHQNPEIAKIAQTFRTLPNMEWDISELLDCDDNDMFDRALKKKSKSIALQFEKPSKVCKDGFQFTEFWRMD